MGTASKGWRDLFPYSEVDNEDREVVVVDVKDWRALLRAVTSPLMFNHLYMFNHNNVTMAGANTIVPNEVTVVLKPSPISQAVAEGLWEYEVDTDRTTDPTLSDLTVEDWTCVLLGDTEGEDADDEDTDEDDESEDDVEVAGASDDDESDEDTDEEPSLDDLVDIEDDEDDASYDEDEGDFLYDDDAEDDDED